MFSLLSPGLVELIHGAALNPGELTGCARDRSLEGALLPVGNRLPYGLIEDAYALAAFYGEAIAGGHCFNDGNKRTAFQAMDVCLDLNGIQITWKVEDVGDRIILLSQGKPTADALAEWLKTQGVSGG